MKKQSRLNSLRNFLTPEEEKSFYKPNDFISYKEIELIREFPSKNRDKLFPKYSGKTLPKGEHYTYTVEIRCEDCHKMFLNTSVTKSTVLDIISHRYSHRYDICDKCRKNRQAIELQKMRETEKLRLFRLSKLLNPDYSFNSQLSPYQKFCALRDLMPCSAYQCQSDGTQKTLCSLKYSEFLNTPYWDAISSEIKRKSKYKCKLCGKNNTALNVHHRTYEHHGLEFFYMEDLICLCQNCHTKFHDKEVE